MPAITTTDNKRVEISLGVEEIKFIEALKALPDPRDNRGKRHLLAFLIALLFLPSWLADQTCQVFIAT